MQVKCQTLNAQSSIQWLLYSACIEMPIKKRQHKSASLKHQKHADIDVQKHSEYPCPQIAIGDSQLEGMKPVMSLANA